MKMQRLASHKSKLRRKRLLVNGKEKLLKLTIQRSITEEQNSEELLKITEDSRYATVK